MDLEVKDFEDFCKDFQNGIKEVDNNIETILKRSRDFYKDFFFINLSFKLSFYFIVSGIEKFNQKMETKN